MLRRYIELNATVFGGQNINVLSKAFTIDCNVFAQRANLNVMYSFILNSLVLSVSYDKILPALPRVRQARHPGKIASS